MLPSELPLPPTSPSLLDGNTRPYFLWWTEVRAYWMGALLREANTRDVWLFVTPEDIRRIWLRLARYLGRARAMWAFLLELPCPAWPPPEAYGKTL